MKIICTKEEYTRMVAKCAVNAQNLREEDSLGGCEDCILFEMCTRFSLAIPPEVFSETESYLFLETICELSEGA